MVYLPSYHPPPSPPPLPFPPQHFIYLFCVKKKRKKIKQDKKMSFVPCWLESFFFIQRVDWDFYFPISECWKYCIGEKTQNIIIIIRVVLQLYSMYSHFLSGTWNKHADICFYFVFLVFGYVFLYLSSIRYLHGTGRFASMDPSCFLTSSDFVCTVCIFSKAFEADHKSIGLPVKEAGLVYLLATRHLCNCRVVCCALVLLKHPIKHTVVGLWEKRSALSGICVWLQPLHRQIFAPFSVILHSLCPALNSGTVFMFHARL